MRAFSFGPAGGLATGKQGVDCVIVSDDSSFNPNKNDWSKLPSEPGPTQALCFFDLSREVKGL